MGVEFIRPTDLDLLQSRRGRANVDISILGVPVNNTRTGRGITFAKGDNPPAQLFTTHPQIHELVDANVVDTPAPSLPGPHLAFVFGSDTPGNGAY